MIKKEFWLSCGTIIALSLGIALPLKPAIGQSSTAVPIRMIALVSHQGNNRIALFHVPDSDPYSTSAYGGKLTRYDVHIAKMFEITRHECSKEYFDWRGISWEYSIDNGQREVGTLTISCQQAYQVANAYSLGQTESTEILYYKARNTVSIPILDITGDKVDRWKSFVRSL
ncbi:hypothetical protein [Limnoraphis robusta]|uniref:Uncharacterized protein n=1 Tax=Limnoraphis robusta CCNP1315 TaxID=3110306 RepID=A0ABU5U2J9_9CYAN|nr:hypothetical protein [Limnoraphis robusta]MEA5521417.1 hypothetical protein [Limnoraphis robusta CCNP1315]MEA5544350.1 hypothetical protein [Limnoraphis robusta CCNP1324]